MELRFPIGARYLIYAILGIIFVSTSFLSSIYHPAEMLIAHLTKFSPDSIVFKLWEKPPFEIFVKVYLFNVTNPVEFLNGEQKLRFQEVGPYTYKEILYNVNSTFNDNGTLTFIPKRKLVFNLNNSIGDAQVDRFTFPNIALLGFTSYLYDSSMFTNLAVSSLASYLKSKPFLNLTVDEYLLGYDDDLIKLANNYVPNWIDFKTLGILDRVMAVDNSSDFVTINIKPELDYSFITQSRSTMPYAVERWAYSPGLTQWGFVDSTTDPQNSMCNTVEGTFMGTLFPQNMSVNNTIRLFRSSFCRPIPFNFYENKIGTSGYNVNVYKVDPKFLVRAENNSDNACYCQKDDIEDCLPNGVGDASPCYYGIPVSISQPHFLNADASVLEKFDGLHPDEEKHGMVLGIHPELGVPLEFNMRAQINLAVPNTKYNSKVKPFNNLVIPLLWVDMTLESLPSVINFYICLLYYVLPVGEDILIYGLGVLGFVLLSYSSIIAVLSALKDSNYKSLKFKYIPVKLILSKQKQLNCDLNT